MKYRVIARNRKKKNGYLTHMICLEDDCGHLWVASRVSNPCPKCASEAIVPMSKWSPARNGMPKLEMGKVVTNA